MKRLWNILFAIIIVCGTTTLMTSCGGDDDGGGSSPSPSAPSFKKVQVTYSVAASSALLNDFRINAYYIDAQNNSSLPETMTSPNWQKVVEVDASKMPATFELYYALAPKNKEQGAKATATGEVQINFSMTVKTINSDGSEASSKQLKNSFKADALTPTTVLSELAKDANKAEHLKVTVGKDGKMQ